MQKYVKETRHHPGWLGARAQALRHLSLKLEQFIYELAQLDENTGETQEARMDTVVESPNLRAMIDVRCFFSQLKSGWVSARSGYNS